MYLVCTGFFEVWYAHKLYFVINIHYFNWEVQIHSLANSFATAALRRLLPR
jgi:hypothetical protein